MPFNTGRITYPADNAKPAYPVTGVRPGLPGSMPMNLADLIALASKQQLADQNVPGTGGMNNASPRLGSGMDVMLDPANDPVTQTQNNLWRAIQSGDKNEIRKAKMAFDQAFATYIDF